MKSAAARLFIKSTRRHPSESCKDASELNVACLRFAVEARLSVDRDLTCAFTLPMNFGPKSCLSGWLLMICLGGQSIQAETNAPAGFGFNRIIHGWTNYSTAFNVTHDPAPDGEYASVASFYTPAVDIQPIEYSAIVIWFGSGGQRLDFADFAFRVHFWSSLDAFIGNPRLGDVASFAFVAPTGGSTTSPDTTTRGGRPAYLIRFQLPGASLTLTQCQTYLVGLSVQASSLQAGELYVPTAPYDGESDVQAGNIVPFGWQYLFNSGGQTIYSGQLATELKVQPIGGLPRLDIRRTAAETCLTWLETAGCYTLESCANLDSPAEWSPVIDIPAVENGSCQFCLPNDDTMRWYRLRKDSNSTFISR
jgi:hypothetical protein